MPLAQEDFTEVTEFVKANIVSWLNQENLGIGSSSIIYEVDFRERMIRLEEELKHQRELMQQGFDIVNLRMQEQREDFNNRFEDFNNRFEDFNKRFEEQRQDMNQRFEEQRQDMSQRFEKVDRRFEEQTKRMERFMVWSFGMTVTAVIIIISAIKYL